MKRLIKVSALIAAMTLTCAFFGCSDGDSSNDGNSTISFDDCTITATEITLTDGNWTLKITESDDDGMSSEMNIKATASDGSFTYQSGSGTMTVDLSEMLEEDELTEFNTLSTDEKKQEIIEEMDCPEDATITFNGNIVTIKASLSTEDLANIQSGCDLSSIPSEAVIKTNSDKTKYTITLFDHGYTMVFYISKD